MAVHTGIPPFLNRNPMRAPRPFATIPMTDLDYVTVHVAPTEMAAQLICGLLISEGLHARLGGEERAYSFGMETKEVGVPRMEQEQALEILAAWEESRRALP